MTTPEVLGVATITALRRSDRRNFTTGPGSAFTNGSVTTVEVIAGKVDGPKKPGALIASQISEAHLEALRRTPYLSVEFKAGERAPEPEAPEDVQAQLLREVQALRDKLDAMGGQMAEMGAALGQAQQDVAEARAAAQVAHQKLAEIEARPVAAPPALVPVPVEATTTAAPPAAVKPAAPVEAKPAPAPAPATKTKRAVVAVPLPSDTPAAAVPSSGPAPTK